MRPVAFASALFTKRTPYYVHYGVTHRCNLTCKMCGIWKLGDRKSEMSLEQIEAMAENLRRLGTGAVSLGGGEPFMRHDLGNIIRIFQRKKIEVRLLTNGYIHNPKTLNDVLSTGVRHVSISLDTTDLRKFGDICNKDDVWVRAVETIGTFARHFQKIGGGVGTLNCVVSHENLQELEGVLDLAEAYGFAVSFIPIEVHEYAGKVIEKERAAHMFVQLQEHAELEAAYGQLIQWRREGRAIFSTTPFMKESLRTLRGEQPEWECLAGWLYFSVSPEGDFSICHRYKGTGVRAVDTRVYDADFVKVYKSREVQEESRKTASACKACVRPCWAEVSMAFTHPVSFAEMAWNQKPRRIPGGKIPTTQEALERFARKPPTVAVGTLEA